MKRFLSILVCLVALLPSQTSCKEPVEPEPEMVPVREVLISRTKDSLKIGQSLTLTANI